jgi:reactive chlorine resistance protein C
MHHNRNVWQDRWPAAIGAIVAAFIPKLQPLGTGVLRYGLVFLLLFWGGLKFAMFEAEAIQPLLAYSPLMSWMLAVFDVRTASAIIGVTEIIFGLGILTRRL